MNPEPRFQLKFQGKGALFEGKPGLSPTSCNTHPPTLKRGDFYIFLGMRVEEEPGTNPEAPPDREFFYKFLWNGNLVEFRSWLSFEPFFDKYFTLKSVTDV